MYSCRYVLPALILSVLLAFGGCTSIPSSPSSPLPEQAGQPVQSPVSSGNLALRVGSLGPGSVLPDAYTCKGAGESPPVSWSGVPDGTKSLVLILDDPDAPAGIFTHWLVFNIPPQSTGIDKGQSYAKVIANGAQQGESTPGSRGYYYPCPPPGSTHRYIFRLYALDEVLILPTADRTAIDTALSGHTIAKTEFLTTVSR
ncbi:MULTISPECIES: YbhB/YbcL family Raf kinase inhibitor-like protein [unclassified Methanoregula]|uniref:YbhB/YbcL family Raf kinase inhibitor-like protein n=1 Tax=unclassified Methanoregula TaxID=2649730 RepID=UPI0009CEAF84|nr:MULTISPECIES: YbhB/YbcL family Raf kinase inhibitor-like protein [unclassified Methanoregula]OPX62018.1 MAG: putative kinase inhibitor protein [Methanoregula sp. PtaB.Bin085]OPY34307.1 MAG: putative kinase inhibitor protein [Methanoregula sp. PtaU1.Bin006]